MNSDERVYNMGWYIALSIGTLFGLINVVRFFRVNKEVARLKNEIIGLNDIIRVQKLYIKELENDKGK